MPSRPPGQTSSPLAPAAALICCALLAACPGTTDVPVSRDSNSGGSEVTIKGRVVDFESCMTTAGCQGVAEMQVALFYNTAVVSERTAPDGSFTLKGVPNGVRVLLLVNDTEGGRYLSTLQAGPITTSGSDVFGVELYALEIEGGLYEAIETQLQLDVEDNALYLGQVLELNEDRFKAYPGANVTVSPAATLRYVKTNPRFENSEVDAFFPASREATGQFGQFVIAGDPAGRDYAVLVESGDSIFNPILAPMKSGYIAIGLHEASPKPDGGIPPPPDAGSDIPGG